MVLAGVCALTAYLAPAVCHAQTSPDPWWGRDKALHFSISTGISATGYGIARFAGSSRTTGWLIGVGASAAIGAGKEVADMTGMGQASWRDFTWDIAGSLLGATIAWGLDLALTGGSSSPTTTVNDSRSTQHALVITF